MSAPVIRVVGLDKRYGQRRAVAELDLQVDAGEVFALLGPNGAGKSTTVEVLEGYRRRDAGTVEVLGVDPARPTRQWRTRIGIVLQAVNDLGELSVLEAVRHFAVYYPNARDPDEVLETVGLTEQRGSRVRQLSGGQRRRLDVALGILGRPELLFLDEPTTGFDPQARRLFWSLIEELSATGTTILLTTHYLDEAEHLADRVGVIAAGRLLAVDAPASLGDRGSAAAQVCWRDGDGEHSAHVHDPTRLVAELAQRYGGEVPELTVTRPTLEDAYLALLAASGHADAGPGA